MTNKILLFIPDHKFIVNELMFVGDTQFEIVDNLDLFLSSTNSVKIAVVAQYKKEWIDAVKNCTEVVIVVPQLIGAGAIDLIKKYDLPNFTFALCGDINFDLTHARTIPDLFWITNTVDRYTRDLKHLLTNRLTPFNTKPWAFDVLYGRPRSHRKFVKQQLEAFKETNYFLQSPRFFESPNDPLIAKKTDYLFDPNNSHDKFYFDSSLFWEDEMIPCADPSYKCMYFGEEVSISTVLPLKVYQQTAYSLITETELRNDSTYFSEKIAKPLAAGRLFIVISGQYYLKNLRKLGFKTFDGIIDESYDLEPDNETRWNMAIQQAVQLAAMDQQTVFEKLIPIVMHNFKTVTTLSMNALGEYTNLLLLTHNSVK